MPPPSEANTNRSRGGEGSDREGWDDTSIDLSSLEEQGCSCRCDGGCRGNCGCATCISRVDHFPMESNQVQWPGQGGSDEAVPSQPVNIPDTMQSSGLGESLDSLVAPENNSFEASRPHPLTRSNLLRHTARSLEDHQDGFIHQWRGNASDKCPVLIACESDMEDVLSTPDFDNMSLEESMIVNEGQASQSRSLLGEWSRPLTRSSPSASVFLAGLRHNPQSNYVRTPLRLVPECRHAQIRPCGCHRGP